MLPEMQWPRYAPGVSDFDWWFAFDRSTYHRPKQASPERVESRARRLLYAYGMPPGELSGSQYKYGPPYYTELFAHEMGHLMHLGFKLPALRGVGGEVLDESMKHHLTRFEGNENEIEAAATSTLVLEYLGFSYTITQLIGSTVSNLRGGMRYRDRAEVYKYVRLARSAPRTREAARQIYNLLLKIKHGHQQERQEAQEGSAS